MQPRALQQTRLTRSVLATVLFGSCLGKTLSTQGATVLHS